MRLLFNGKKFEEIFIRVLVNFLGIGVLLNWNTDQYLGTGFSGLGLGDLDGGFVDYRCCYVLTFY